MKNLLFVLAILFYSNISFSANEYFRSVTSGNWNSTSTWEMSTNSGSTWIAATLTPNQTSGPITVQNPNTVTVTADVSADQLTVIGGGTISINTLIALTIVDGIGEDFYLNSTATILGAGKLQTQGSAIILHIRGGSNFNIALRVVSGITTPYDAFAPNTVNLNGPVTVEASAVLNTALGGYTNRFYGTVQNYGTFTTGSGSTIRIAGASFLNNGTLSGTVVYFDAATSVSGTGTFTGVSMIVSITGNLTLTSNVSFSPSTSLTLNLGGTINPNSFIFTFNSGSFIMKSDSYVLNSGAFQTQGSVSLKLRSGCFFSCPLKINTGTSTCYDDLTFNSTVNGSITVDAGATLAIQSGAYTFLANNNLTNNGMISGNSVFKFKGSVLSNNGSISVTTFNVESGSHSAQGIGTWSTTLNILNSASLGLSDNFQIRDVNINNGGSLNQNSYKLILTGTNPLVAIGTFNASTGSTEYKGTSAQNINSTGYNFNKLIINNSNGATLQSNITVNDTLTLILGDLDLNGNIMTLSASGYLNETGSYTVKGSSGYIITSRNLNAPSMLNAGGLGAIISTSVNLGSTQIIRGHTIQSGLQGGSGIKRYYEISPSINSGLNASLIFRYADSELNGNTESGLALFRSTNSGSNWTVGGGTTDTSANTITLNSVDAFSRWSAATPVAVASVIKLFPQAFLNTGSNMLNSKDTVRVYLRNSISPYDIVDSANSVIDSVSFSGSFLFQNADAGTYYLDALHRNSIETWSRIGGEIYIKGAVFNYDFTSDSSNAYGNNLRKVNSLWGLISGDVDQTGNVNLSDILEVYDKSSSFTSGYTSTDVNGDGIVNLNDLVFTFNNSVLFAQKVTP